MNPFSFVYNEFLFRPLFNILVALTLFIPGHSLGWAILGVTLIVRLILLPVSLHHAKSTHKNQKKMAEVQDQLKQIKEDHKDDKAKQAEETMKVYREAGINPAGGCLPLLIQLPILIALYRVFLIGISPETFNYLYSFVSAPEVIQNIFFGIPLDTPSFRLALIAGLGQFALMRWFTPSPAQATPAPGQDESTAQLMASMQKNMAYFFPVMTIVISLQLPAALALYWAASTIFAIGQQLLVKKLLHSDQNLPVV